MINLSYSSQEIRPRWECRNQIRTQIGALDPTTVTPELWLVCVPQHSRSCVAVTFGTAPWACINNSPPSAQPPPLLQLVHHGSQLTPGVNYPPALTCPFHHMLTCPHSRPPHMPFTNPHMGETWPNDATQDQSLPYIYSNFPSSSQQVLALFCFLCF
jgi:hypothetical protein